MKNTIVITDGQALVQREDGGMHRASIAELTAEVQRLRAENPPPGPMAAAIANTFGAYSWRERAASWLLEKALEQESNNLRWPEHAREYASWRLKPRILRYLAAELVNVRQLDTDSGAWLVWFEEPSMKHDIFWGHGAPQAAYSRFERARDHWSCHLFARILDGTKARPKIPPTDL